MPKKSPTATKLTPELARAIAKRRAAARGVRVAGDASARLGDATLGQLATKENACAAATGDRLRVSRALFAGAFELAEAERDGTARLAAAARSAPEALGADEWMVEVDGLVPQLARDAVVELLRTGDADGDEWPFRDDLTLATYYAPLFWNCVAWVGGPATVLAADCSVVRAAVVVLLAGDSDEERRRALLASAGTRGRRSRRT